MSVMRNPPEKLVLYALIAFVLAIVLTLFNIICSYLYFRTVAPGGGWIGTTIAVGTAILVNVIESGTLMVFLSADEAGHLFTPPRIEVPGFPSFLPKLMKFAILGMFGFVLAWTYKIDIESTSAVIRASGSVGFYVVMAVVFGSEFLMILAHTLWALGKFGKLNTSGMWKGINDKLKGLNTVQMPSKPANYQGMQGPPPAQQSETRPMSGGLGAEARKRRA